MKPTPFEAMQASVDIVLSSPHPDNKVAASLFSGENLIAKTNEWPEEIFAKIGPETRIGDSSGTLHAEINCILNFEGPTNDAALTITDPCCPNCAKAIAESGIKALYIDHKGFLKDFAARRGDDFQDMSLAIMAHAGISIYEINRKAETLTPIHLPEDGYIPPEDNPIEIKPFDGECTDEEFQNLIDSVTIKHERWGCAFAKDKDEKIHTLVASTHPAVGYSGEQKSADEKYDFYLEPLNRLLFGAARHNLALIDGFIWTSTLPSSRDLVNFIGAGLKKLSVGSLALAKKDSALRAKNLLEEKGIIMFRDIRRKI